MNDTDKKLETLLKKFFPSRKNDKIINGINISQMDILFHALSHFDHEYILNFILEYEDILVEMLLANSKLKNDLLYTGDAVYKTNESKITKEYIKNIIQNIKERKFSSSEFTLMLIIIDFKTMYDEYPLEKQVEIINLKIYNIVKKDNFIYDKHLSIEELKKYTNMLLKWHNLFGDNNLENVINLDLLKERLLEIYNCNIPLVQIYKKTILSMIQTIDLLKNIMDNNICTIDKDYMYRLNSLFEDYEKINKSIIKELLENNEYMLIHFVQSYKVNYQLINDKIIDTSCISSVEELLVEHEQNNIFSNNYLEYAKKEIEKKFRRTFNIHNELHRGELDNYLKIYNDTFNYKPLDRLPINLKEIGSDFRIYIRPSSNRLSCSFVAKENIKSHLNRNVGLIIKPKSYDAIISTSIGYTSQKDDKDFYLDSVSLSKLIEQTAYEIGVNEICVDTTKCEVIGVICLEKDEKSIQRAEELAHSYSVEVLYFNKKNIKLLDIFKHY